MCGPRQSDRAAGRDGGWTRDGCTVRLAQAGSRPRISRCRRAWPGTAASRRVRGTCESVRAGLCRARRCGCRRCRSPGGPCVRPDPQRPHGGGAGARPARGTRRRSGSDRPARSGRSAPALERGGTAGRYVEAGRGGGTVTRGAESHLPGAKTDGPRPPYGPPEPPRRVGERGRCRGTGAIPYGLRSGVRRACGRGPEPMDGTELAGRAQPGAPGRPAVPRRDRSPGRHPCRPRDGAGWGHRDPSTRAQRPHPRSALRPARQIRVPRRTHVSPSSHELRPSGW